MSSVTRTDHLTRPEAFTVLVDGEPTVAYPGETLISVLLAADIRTFRMSVTGEPRGPVCNMACCLECFVTVDGTARVLACMTPVVEGMTVTTFRAAP